MKRSKTSLYVFGLGLVMALHHAASQAELLPVYYGLNIGNAKYDLAGGGDPTFAAYLGQHINENIAIEGGYTSLGEGGLPGASANVTALYGGAVFSLHSAQSPQLSGFLNGGFTSWYYKAGAQRDQGVDMYMGLGAMYKLNENLSYRLGWSRYVLNPRIGGLDLDEEISVINFGVQYLPQ